ncbi:hypothetical protein QTI66_29940 [Variovorax sp. J22R133]|uniref:hypothetical protein n=1 Tax=Variovorax brevis TaxID=3053503 RepID=UPI0025760FB1|nr:hypothetical protein [Variovorax sp. J22R133]MDM0116378.1 hypothetical protein [Variovorax sp. J22R133]
MQHMDTVHQRRRASRISFRNTCLVMAATALAGCNSFPGGVFSQGSDYKVAQAGPADATQASAPMADRQMRAMREMHQKLMAATTPAQRCALMDEQRKIMQDGMAMMAPMDGAMPMDHSGMTGHSTPRNMDSVERRMGMMEMMMQMMLDRESAMPGGPGHRHGGCD